MTFSVSSEIVDSSTLGEGVVLIAFDGTVIHSTFGQPGVSFLEAVPPAQHEIVWNQFQKVVSTGGPQFFVLESTLPQVLWVAGEAIRTRDMVLCKQYRMHQPMGVSERQVQIAICLGHGWAVERTARVLGISTQTVRSHICNLRAKFRFNDQDELLVACARRLRGAQILAIVRGFTDPLPAACLNCTLACTIHRRVCPHWQNL